jgi:hypothetical protein
MQNLIQTIPGHDYSRVNARVFNTDGCIVDLGCAHWDWSKIFIGKKRVIGADPFEPTTPPGCCLFNGVVTSYDGLVRMHYDKDASSILNAPVSAHDCVDMFPAISWKNFCRKFDIDGIAVLKLNSEGAEYSLLNSLDDSDYAKIDQIAVSFHHWLHPQQRKLADASIYLLQQHGFQVTKIGEYEWHLATK